jgi:hypothetical protein
METPPRRPPHGAALFRCSQKRGHLRQQANDVIAAPFDAAHAEHREILAHLRTGKAQRVAEISREHLTKPHPLELQQYGSITRQTLDRFAAHVNRLSFLGSFYSGHGWSPFDAVSGVTHFVCARDQPAVHLPALPARLRPCQVSGLHERHVTRPANVIATRSMPSFTRLVHSRSQATSNSNYDTLLIICVCNGIFYILRTS